MESTELRNDEKFKNIDKRDRIINLANQILSQREPKEKIYQELENEYISKYGNSIQQEFLASLRAKVYTEEEQAEQIDKEMKSKNLEIDGNISVDKINQTADDIAKDVTNIDKKDKSKDKDENYLNVKSNVLKKIYEVALDEYNKFKVEIQKELINDEKQVVDDRIFSKYLMYQNYLRKIDNEYQNINGRYIFQADDDIKKKEKKWCKEDIEQKFKMQKYRSRDAKKIIEKRQEINELTESLDSLGTSLLIGDILQNDYNRERLVCLKNIELLNIELDNLTFGQKEFEQDTNEENKRKNITDEFLGKKYIDTKGKFINQDPEIVKFKKQFTDERNKTSEKYIETEEKNIEIKEEHIVKNDKYGFSTGSYNTKEGEIPDDLAKAYQNEKTEITKENDKRKKGLEKLEPNGDEDFGAR